MSFIVYVYQIVYFRYVVILFYFFNGLEFENLQTKMLPNSKSRFPSGSVYTGAFSDAAGDDNCRYSSKRPTMPINLKE